MFNFPMVKKSPNATFKLGLLALTLCLGFPANGCAKDLVIGHFSGTNYGDWKTTGTAFNLGPASDGRLPKLGIENARDNNIASSEMEGDGPTGTLTSPEFKISRKYISFLISGGDYEHDTCINLPAHQWQNYKKRDRLAK